MSIHHPPPEPDPDLPPTRGMSTTAKVVIILAVVFACLCAGGLPILIFLIKVGWPMVKQHFSRGMEDLQEGADEAADDAGQPPSEPRGTNRGGGA